MIDPVNIIKYDYTDRELEELLVFGVCVAGKTAKVIAPKVHAFCGHHPTMTPFQVMYSDLAHNNAFTEMYHQKLGKYKVLDRAFFDMVTKCKWSGNPHARTGVHLIDLRTCTVEELEGINGIGPKTARFFLMSSRRNVRHAALDTHILKYMKTRGITCPKSTPSNRKLYARLENEFLKLADKSGMTPAEFDLKIWNMYARK
jgi:thermostable 8-oxoguanine DNA glycosylase